MTEPIKLGEVNAFYRDRAKINGFLTRLDTLYTLEPTKYSTDVKKTLYAAYHIKGIAYDWISPYLQDYLDNGNGSSDTTKEIIGKWTTIKEKLHKAVMSMFKQGLSRAIQWDIRKERPDTLDELIDAAIDAENELQEFNSAQPKNNSANIARAKNRPNSANVSKPRFYGGPMPIDLDAANKKRNYTKGLLIQAEKDRRLRNNLCLYCGKPRYVVNDCRAKNNTKPF
ncbi:hypothetical protein LTR05_008825 [Lithohypha guttulata]|uniref:Retrotransposon gag domain-containing protein n=1 Tax=Lithohypha guttulata TaxID=1690604 RepID=A0AAN7SRU4_9EURO|nr:hypothetical protein LTR05_008825 [Lithohypha guttulata]